jgi:hypothetical protein
MIFRDSMGLAACALIWMSSCAGKSAQSDSGSGGTAQNGTDASAEDATGGGTTVGLPACTWPASLDAADGETGQCVAARAYLSCKGSNGGGELCLSNDPTQCPGLNPIVGTTFFGCVDQCAADEYAVGCGGPGPGPWPQPPAGCRSLPSGPGGGSVLCCPCDQVALPDAASDAPVLRDVDGDADAAKSGEGGSDAGAGSFDCGGTMTCDGHSQLCEHVQGGPAPGVNFYQCSPIPAACMADVSCTCVTSALALNGATSCAATGGNLTVQIDTP